MPIDTQSFYQQNPGVSCTGFHLLCVDSCLCQRQEQEVHDFMTKMINLSIYDMANYYATNRSIYEVSDNGDMEVRESPSGKEVTGKSIINFYFAKNYATRV